MCFSTSGARYSARGVRQRDAIQWQKPTWSATERVGFILGCHVDLAQTKVAKGKMT